MKWSICGLLLVVVAVSARGLQEKEQYQGVVSPLLTTIKNLGSNVKERRNEKSYWYCYELTTFAEEPIAMSQVDMFATGANKEGQKIEVGKLSLLTSENDGSKGLYCAAGTAETIKHPLTPNNDKIKFQTIDSTKFYSTRVMVRDPLSILEGFHRLKAILTKLGLGKKVNFDRLAVIYKRGESGGDLVYPAA